MTTIMDMCPACRALTSQTVEANASICTICSTVTCGSPTTERNK